MLHATQMDLTLIIQGVTVLGAGFGAMKYLDTRFSALREDINKRFATFDKRLDKFVTEKECDIKHCAQEGRFERIEERLNQISGALGED